MVIDINCQYFGSGSIKPLIERMDRAGINKTLLSASIEGACFPDKGIILRDVGNLDVAKAVKAFPDRLIGCMHINPLAPDAVETLERYVQEGFKAVKFFPAEGYYPDDPRFYSLFDRLNDYKMTALFYMGQINFSLLHDNGKRRALNSAYAYPMRLDAPSRLFPGVRFVIIHMGFPFMFEAWSVHHANKNIYLEISGCGAYFDAIPVSYTAVGGSAFIPLDFDKVVWGSDNVEDTVASITTADSYLKLMGCIDAGKRKNVFGANAARILGLAQ